MGHTAATERASPTDIGPAQRATSGSLLALGVEQAGVRACLVENVAGQHRLVGWLGLQNDGTTEIPLLIANACIRLGQRLGRQLWDEHNQEPLLDSEDPLRYPPLHQVGLGLAARSPLRVWVAAVSRTSGLAAFAAVTAAVPMQIVGETILTTDLSPEQLARAMQQHRPEALVIVGGFDVAVPAAQIPILSLCRVLASALLHLPVEERPALFFAGNRAAAAVARSLFEGAVTILPNLVPRPDQVQVSELLQALNYHHWRLSERMAGYNWLSRWVTSPGQVSSLASNFVQVAQIWREQQQLASLHAVYAASQWTLHVLSERHHPGVHLIYAAPQVVPNVLDRWPPAQLISGRWAGDWARSAPVWWDREGLAPIIAALGQVAPLAMAQVLNHDLLLPV